MIQSMHMSRTQLIFNDSKLPKWPTKYLLLLKLISAMCKVKLQIAVLWKTWFSLYYIRQQLDSLGPVGLNLCLSLQNWSYVIK